MLLAWLGPARAEWKVHRQGPEALLERAERALRERPDDDAIARRLVQLATPAQRQAIRERFKARAEVAASYAPTAAYARLLLALGDAAAAVTAFSDATRLSPKSVAALIGRARALAAVGSIPESLASYDEALRLEKQPQPRRRIIEAELGLLAARAAKSAPESRDLDRQIALRRELVGLDPDADGAASRLADALERADRLVEAADVLDARLPEGRLAGKLDLALRAARLRVQGGSETDATRAAARLDDLLRQLPRADDERRRELWSLALVIARKRGTVADVAHKLGALGDRASVVELEVLGQTRDELGDLDGALAALRTADGRPSHDPETARRIISLLDRLGRDDEATRTCGALARRNPDDVRLVIDLIDRLMRRGRRDDAGATLEEALPRFARDAAALTDLAFAAARWGDQGHALATWQRLRRLDPKSEVAIIGLGESEFQRGHKEEAKRLWSSLRDGARVTTAGHIRMAEVLLDHDLAQDAATEARRAQAIEPHGIPAHRLLARIFERERRLEDAITEWNVVLALAGRTRSEDPRQRDEHLALRREARVRLLALYSRQGRGRLQAQIRRLAEEARARPDDVEAVMYLAEAQERAGDAPAATTTLEELLARLPAATGTTTVPARDDATVDATLALVQLLKRSGRVEEAVQRLAAVARVAPGRARETHLQIAEIALARYDTPRALEHAALAAAGADATTLARVGELEARAGAERSALETYRRAVDQGGGPQTELAWAKLLVREGDRATAESLLGRLLVSATDDDVVSEAGRYAVDLGELSDHLTELEQRLGGDAGGAAMTLAHQRTLIATLKRVVPPLYRLPGADPLRLRIGRRVLRPLLDAVTDADQAPDRDAIELLGMLGNGEAAPALTRILSRPRESPGPARGKAIRAETGITAEVQSAAVVALGRLADPRGRQALERLSATADPALRAMAVWSLGRLADERVLPILLAALADRRPEVASAGCLGLGRQTGERAAVALLAAAVDPTLPTSVRTAAIVGLGRSGHREAVSSLFAILDAGDEVLSRAAALALGWSGDARAVSGLFSRALIPRRFALASSSVAMLGVDVAASAQPVPDEAREGWRPGSDLEALLLMPVPPSSRSDVSLLLRSHAREIQSALLEALDRGGAARLEALIVLDARDDGPGLGPLTEEGTGRSGPETPLLAREIAQPLGDRLVALLDDEELEPRALVLRILTKLGDERLFAVEALAALGPPARGALERAGADKHALVRATAAAARLGQPAIDLPAAPSTMP